MERAPFVTPKTEIAVHPRKVEHMAAVRHGAGGKARAGPLDRDGRIRRGAFELGQDGAKLRFVGRKRYGRGFAHGSRFVTPVFVEFRRPVPYAPHVNLFTVME